MARQIFFKNKISKMINGTHKRVYFKPWDKLKIRRKIKKIRRKIKKIRRKKIRRKINKKSVAKLTKNPSQKRLPIKFGLLDGRSDGSIQLNIIFST
jgi:hypothetical protein